MLCALVRVCLKKIICMLAACMSNAADLRMLSLVTNMLFLANSTFIVHPPDITGFNLNRCSMTNKFCNLFTVNLL